MNIDLIFKIAGTGIIVAVLNLVLKRAERDEQAMMTTVRGCKYRRCKFWTGVQKDYTSSVDSYYGIYSHYFHDRWSPDVRYSFPL